MTGNRHRRTLRAGILESQGAGFLGISGHTAVASGASFRNGTKTARCEPISHEKLAVALGREHDKMTSLFVETVRGACPPRDRPITASSIVAWIASYYDCNPL